MSEEEFEQKLKETDNNVLKVVEYLRKTVDVFASPFGRCCIDSDFNKALSRQGDEKSIDVRYMPEIIGMVNGKIFYAEVKSKDRKDTTNFSINERDRLRYIDNQNLRDVKTLIICEDLPRFIGVHYLEKSSIYSDIKGEGNGSYRLIAEDDLYVPSRFFYTRFLNGV